MCSFCLIIPVFIIIVWNVCLSIAHILTSVSAEKETITEEFDILPAKALMMFKFFIITQWLGCDLVSPCLLYTSDAADE